MLVNEEEARKAIVDKFKPWFPMLRATVLPTAPVPTMSPTEALMIIEADIDNLYNGSSGLGTMRDYALAVLWKTIRDWEPKET